MVKYLRKNYDVFTKPLLEKFQAYRESLTKLSTMDFLNKNVNYGSVDSGKVSRSCTVSKLLDCSSTEVDKTELFIVEGDSAGGTLQMARNPKIHAVLPLRGKTLNVVNATLERIVTNTEFNSLINSLGCGIHPKEDVSKLRYGKIIICTDADPDGAQICALLLGAFSKLTPELVKSGKLWIACTPLYKQGSVYVWDEANLDKSKPFKRFKGLGELNASELKETAIEVTTRVISQVTADDTTLQSTTSLIGDSSYRKNILIKGGVI